MTWQCFQIAYELRSPLHIGYHKVGNVQRTRYYIPARNLWGAITERLTRSGFETNNVSEGDYRQVGAWVKDHLAFTYFFMHNGNHLLFPAFSEQGLCYGNLREYEFERRYISSLVTTALDAATTSAEANSLHEVESIATRCKAYPCKGHHTEFHGWIFLDEVASPVIGNKEKWKHWLGELQIGGERRYGFGRLIQSENGWTKVNENEIFLNYIVGLNQSRPQIEVAESKPVLAHTLTSNVRGKGMIEPLIGRETDTKNSRTFGRNLTRGKICWVPGTLLESATTLKINREGLWESANSETAGQIQPEESEAS